MAEKNENAGASAGNEQNFAKRKKRWLRPVLLLAGAKSQTTIG